MMYHTEFCGHMQLANRCEVTMHRCTLVCDVGTSLIGHINACTALRPRKDVPTPLPVPIWYKSGGESRNSPGVAQRVPGGLGSQIFMTFGI